MLARASAADGAERVVGVRTRGSGQQYEVKWRGQEETTWEAASRARKQIPQLVQEFEQQQQQQQSGDTTGEGAPLLHAVVAPSGNNAMLEQMAALEQMVRDQSLQLQQLRASPVPSPQQSPQLSPQQSPTLAQRSLPAAAAAAAPQQSRFARKEPRSQDLREYDGASGTKLEEWLDELGAAVELFELTEGEAVRFATSRLRDAARQWWNALGSSGKAGIANVSTLTTAMRSRFQPITAAHTAREQLDKLAQGSRSVNDYIADFQRLSARLPNMAQEDALHAFIRGLRRDIAIELRKQRVVSIGDAVELAAHVGSFAAVATAATSHGRAAVNQMDISDTDTASGMEDRIARAVLNAMQTQGGAAGLGAKTQTHRGYNSERGASSRGGGTRGGRGGRVGGRGGFTYTIPGVPAALVDQRRAAGQCLRCGSVEHRGMECPNAPSATQLN